MKTFICSTLACLCLSVSSWAYNCTSTCGMTYRSIIDLTSTNGLTESEKNYFSKSCADRGGTALYICSDKLGCTTDYQPYETSASSSSSDYNAAVTTSRNACRDSIEDYKRANYCTVGGIATATGTVYGEPSCY